MAVVHGELLALRQRAAVKPAMPVEGAPPRACTHEIAHPRAREEGAAEGAVELARDTDGAVGGQEAARWLGLGLG